MLEQIKEYLNKYRIKSKEQLENHIEELSRNTYPDKDLVFILASVLDDEELFSREKENKKVLYSTVESYSKQALKDIYGELANIVMNCKGAYEVKQKPMNRLVEEELEKQEQQVFKDWNVTNKEVNSTSTVGWDIFKPIEFHLDSPTKENLNNMSDNFLQRVKNDSNKSGILGKKETKGKLDYELDWVFIQQMAERMNQNKGKYEPYNWKKLMDVEKLKQSLFRHVIEVMKGNYSDDGREYGHLESLADNAMMINYQLKNNK